ncbi:GSCFA domain-containing protein [Hwanghaeella grinnelliae]|uniref:GSCFA domain-containing protein n=1 Tax=Hwanghaeella grinnelliae TaxID=2500179 RepID=UPI0013868B20|nr:GSCFA domain-containing protein [Hwanghaeella grinnelliae]
MSIENFVLESSIKLAEEGKAEAALTLVHLAKKKEPLSRVIWEIGVKLNVEAKKFDLALFDIEYVRSNAQIFDLDINAPSVFSDEAVEEIQALREQYETERLRQKAVQDLMAGSMFLRFGENKSMADFQRNIVFIGNCQAIALARLTGHLWKIGRTSGLQLADYVPYDQVLPVILEDCGTIYIQDHIGDEVRASIEKNRHPDSKLLTFPNIFFKAYMPDVLMGDIDGKQLLSPLRDMNSSIVLYAWVNGLDVEQTASLFSRETYETLGWYRYWEAGKKFLEAQGTAIGLPLGDLFQRWVKKGRFVHDPLHPKLFALVDVARALAERDGIVFQDIHLRIPSPEMFEPFFNPNKWPIYPGFGGPSGGGIRLEFVSGEQSYPSVLNLRQFIEHSFKRYDADGHSKEACQALLPPEFDLLSARLSRKTAGVVADETQSGSGKRVTPYDDCRNNQFWRRSFPINEGSWFRPLSRSDLRVHKTTRIATAGSCFAQHISRYLKAHGYNFYVSESAPENLSEEQQRHAQYGVFSARFGNIYTARQLAQLFNRAYGKFQPVDDCWTKDGGADGGPVVDPFRPTVEPDGFGSAAKMLADRQRHLAAVRDLFEQSDILIFTLGLTEAWRSRQDGAVYPLAPGVAGGRFDAEQHEFVNFTYPEVVDDLNGFLAGLKTVNDRAQVILTVSPVPLIATYENQHVLLSTTYSKSVLRAAAEDISSAHENVSYFPSYEIITGAYNKGAYFDDDLRTVTDAGVDHVMRVFRDFVGMDEGEKVDQQDDDFTDLMSRFQRESAVICDEEEIDSRLA